MRTISRFVLPWMVMLWTVMGATLVFAAPPAGKAPPKADAPPPPGLNDPGVSASTPAAGAQNAAAPADAAEAAAVEAPSDPLAPLPKPDTRLVRDRADRDPNAVAQRVAMSEHTTRTQDGDTVDEYRQNGKVWMIHIVPQGGGPGETFMDTTGTGRLTRDPQQGPVSPVYFSLYEWN